MENVYEEIMGLYQEENKQKRGYLFEQLIREIQPWTCRPPISAIGNGEQLDGIYEWEGRVFIIEAKAKEGKIMQGSSDWEDFELKVRRRNKSVVGLFLSLYEVDERIVMQCEIMNREGYSVFVLYGDIWNKLYSDPISFELILKYLLINSRVNNKATISDVVEIKKWYFHVEDIVKRCSDVCVKGSGKFLRRFKQEKHEELYVKRTLDEKIYNYIKNLYPKALLQIKKTRNKKTNDKNITFEINREIPAQIIIIRDICGAGKTTFAVENALSFDKYISFSKSASEENVDYAVEDILKKIGNDYGIVELMEINRPVVFVLDSLDEAQGIFDKLKEIKALIFILERLNSVSRKYGLYAYPIAIIFTIREDYWREWESLFEGMRVKHFFKSCSEFSDVEFKIALNNYQNTYHYKICNILEKDDISILSNPLNLYIFSETNKFMGNIEARGIFTASVLHNYFKTKSEEIYKRGLHGITPRIFIDICEEFLSRCAYKSLRLEKSDFYECLENKYALFMPYSEELIRLYESEMIFHFDEENLLVVRHMKFFEYLYADYMIQRTDSLKENDAMKFLDVFFKKLNKTQFVDLVEIYNNVKFLYSLRKCKKTVQYYLDNSNEFMQNKLRGLRDKIARGNDGRIDDYSQIICGENISDGNLLLEAFFVCSAKCNQPNNKELVDLFLKTWKANRNNHERWKLLPKLHVYGLIDEEKVMTQIIKSNSWKEWQVYLGYLIQGYNSKKFIEFMQGSDECDIGMLLERGGEWIYVKRLIDICDRVNCQS